MRSHHTSSVPFSCCVPAQGRAASPDLEALPEGSEEVRAPCRGRGGSGWGGVPIAERRSRSCCRHHQPVASLVGRGHSRRAAILGPLVPNRVGCDPHATLPACLLAVCLPADVPAAPPTPPEAPAGHAPRRAEAPTLPATGGAGGRSELMPCSAALHLPLLGQHTPTAFHSSLGGCTGCIPFG